MAGINHDLDYVRKLALRDRLLDLLILLLVSAGTSLWLATMLSSAPVLLILEIGLPILTILVIPCVYHFAKHWRAAKQMCAKDLQTQQSRTQIQFVENSDEQGIVKSVEMSVQVSPFIHVMPQYRKRNHCITLALVFFMLAATLYTTAFTLPHAGLFLLLGYGEYIALFAAACVCTLFATLVCMGAVYSHRKMRSYEDEQYFAAHNATAIVPAVGNDLGFKDGKPCPDTMKQWRNQLKSLEKKSKEASARGSLIPDATKVDVQPPRTPPPSEEATPQKTKSPRK